MNERLKRLEELRTAAAAKVAELKEKRDAITAKVEAEKREDLTEEETAEFRTLRAEVKAEMDRVDDLDEQIDELRSEIERSGRQEERAKNIIKASVTDVREARTYEKGNGKSYVQDLLSRKFSVGDEEAEARLSRHAAEARALNRTDGTGGFLRVAAVAA